MPSTCSREEIILSEFEELPLKEDQQINTVYTLSSVLNPPAPSENTTTGLLSDVDPLINGPMDILHFNVVLSCNSEADEIELTAGDKGFM